MYPDGWQVCSRYAGNQHRHQYRLPATRCHLEGNAIKLRIHLLISPTNIISNPIITIFMGYLGSIDDRFQSFNLTEKQLPFPLGIRPIVQQIAAGTGLHLDSRPAATNSPDPATD